MPIATMRVPADHAVFRGHFPGMPLVPGVMLLEWVLREAAARLKLEPCALRIVETKFFHPLNPDQQADLYFVPGARRHAFRIDRDGQRLAAGVLEPV